MLDKFEIYLSVFAALISAAVSIYQGVTLLEMSVRMIVCIISFYMIGLIVKFYLKKKVFPEPEKTDDSSGENSNGTSDSIDNDPEDDKN